MQPRVALRALERVRDGKHSITVTKTSFLKLIRSWFRSLFSEGLSLQATILNAMEDLAGDCGLHALSIHVTNIQIQALSCHD